MPNGAVISPPESMSGSDEEDNRSHGLHLPTTLKELREAVNQISLRRDSRIPNNTNATTLDALPDRRRPALAPNGIVHSFSTSALDQLHASERRKNQAGSPTEEFKAPELSLSSTKTSATGSEEESEEDDRETKPPMVRKKSGELVRPALRTPSAKRPSSMPGTPTYKAVHFDSHLEHVRHFLQVDRPLAVSAGSSPAEDYDSETEYPFVTLDRPESPAATHQWEIVTTNPPIDTIIRRAQPVRLEKVWLSPDQKSLMGSVAVANLAFQKSVTCRFTLDYWKTTSEVNADFTQEMRDKDAPHTHDRFTFAIKLSDTAHLETKTLYLCIRYNVIGQEFWDNNDHANFQVDFRKTPVTRSSRRSLPGAGGRAAGGSGSGLPRSNRRGNPWSLQGRPKAMPAFGDLGGSGRYSFGRSMDDSFAPDRPRLKHKSSENDNLSGRLPAPSGQAFSNRYDFSASLTAAVQASRDAPSKDRNSDGLYMRSSRPKAPAPAPSQSPKPSASVSNDPSPSTSQNAQSSQNAPSSQNVVPAVPGTGSPSTSLSASSYQEMVNKYCFYVSKDSSPRSEEGTLRGAGCDTAEGSVTTRSTNSSSSSSSHASPVISYPAGPALPTLHDSISLVGSTAASPRGGFTVPRKMGNNLTSSPISMMSGYSGFTSPSPSAPYAEEVSDRFPFLGSPDIFSSPDTHTPTAISS
ncbi:carbohydrate-binding module family 21 protein [Sodiomyces alcalophilus JCM 7366]|uniref:carbohydrate-binding module family 21 protein n=1 Tax=Sodiomyces alcalophilus JCM 7366 TaxID=591952 RepID=UPI0039B4ED9B